MFRDMMQQALHERIGLAPTANTAKSNGTKRPRIPRPQGSISPVRRAVALVVQHPELAQLDLPAGWEQLESPGIELLRQLIDASRAQPGIHSAALVERWQDATTRKHLAKLAVLDLGLTDDAAQQFVGTLQALAAEQQRSEREKLLAKSRSQPLSETEKQRLRELYRAQTATQFSDG